MKTLIQCDFDGTITDEDIGFVLLDRYGREEWRQILQDYKEHKISVDEFNTRAFSMIQADKPTLEETTRSIYSVRDGFHELNEYCSKQGFRLVIVSNGLEFYIRIILQEIGLEHIEVYAAQTEFNNDSLKVQYIGPDGKRSNDGLKETYIKLFKSEGYRVIYLGNGDSDIYAARHAHHIFAREVLLTYCENEGLNYKPFDDIFDVIKGLDSL
ncbi:MtnX-like HAD-IB family phosphatase [Chloroflexota bacterium]